MEWTKPLSVAVVAGVAGLAFVSASVLFGVTLAAEETLVASAVAVAVIALLLLATVRVGARSRRWLENPDSYW